MGFWVWPETLDLELRAALGVCSGEYHFRYVEVAMSKADDFRQQAEEAAGRIEWCERKLAFERKRHKALKDLAASEDWLDGNISPLQKAEGSARES